MKGVKKLVYEILDIQRGAVAPDELGVSTLAFIFLGYCTKKNISDKVSLEAILNSDDIKLAVKETLNIIGESVEGLSEGVEYLNNLKLSNEDIAKILVVLKSYSFNAEQYRDAYEYVLEVTTESLGKRGGGDTTPNFINKLAVEIIEPKNGEFYDGTFGTGGDSIEAYKFASNYGNELKIYGQELNLETYSIAKLRMFVNGIKSVDIRREDSLITPMLIEGENKLKKFDSIVMNPPFGLEWKEKEAEVLNDKYSRFMYGTPGLSSADWLFTSTALKSLNENGKAVVITTIGALFRAGSEEALRKKVIGFDYIEAVIELAGGLFTNTGIPSAMIVFNMNKSDKMKNKIQFINASNLYESVRRGKNILNDENINAILDIYRNNSIINDISNIVDLKELENGSILPSRYVVKTEFESTDYGKVKIHLEKLKGSKTLGDLGDFYRGINVTSKNVQDPKGAYKIINLADIKNGELDVDSLPRYSIENNARVEAYKVEVGDIIISNKGATKICIIPEHDGDVLISQNFIGIRLNNGNNPEYIKELLQSPIGEYLIDCRKTGTSVAMLNTKELKELPIVDINPMEQNKIITEYRQEEEALKKKIQELQNNLDKIKLELYDKMDIGDVFEII